MHDALVFQARQGAEEERSLLASVSEGRLEIEDACQFEWLWVERERREEHCRLQRPWVVESSKTVG